MKTKTVLIFIISYIIAMLNCSLTFAQEPAVSREYISRKSGGDINREERVSVNYSGLQIGAGDKLRVVFLDAGYSVLEEYEVDVSGISETETYYNPEILGGTAYIHIGVISENGAYSGITVPMEI